ncbi:MAG: phosphotransferase family protein [Acidimicrobiia bacterium]|nr:phosphotransferase family protein [Acidimicrobiia bacterium]
MSDAVIGERIRSFIATRLGPEAEVVVDGVVRVGVGRSRENWLFDAHWNGDDGEVNEPLIVRRDPEGGLLETDRRVEFAVLRALESTGVPAPAARWLDPDGAALGRPSLVMVRAPGTCDYFVLDDARRPAPQRVDLARRLCELLALVHDVDWRAAGLGSVLDDPGIEAAAATVDHWESILRRDQLEPYPELELATRWMRANAPRSPATVLVHGDFKVGNVLLDEADEIVALLDWELAHLGDPHEDLGWVTQPLRTREHYVVGHWEREELLGHYEQVSGRSLDLGAVVWWNVMSCYKTAVMQVSGLRSFVENRSDVLYQPTAEVLRTLLDLIEA